MLSTDNQLKFWCSSLKIKQMLLQISFFSFQLCNLHLQFAVLIFLMQVGLLHVFLCFQYIINQLFSHILSFSCDVVVHDFLLRSKGLDFLLVEVKLFLQCLNCFLKAVNLTFECWGECSCCHLVVVDAYWIYWIWHFILFYL